MTFLTLDYHVNNIQINSLGKQQSILNPFLSEVLFESVHINMSSEKCSLSWKEFDSCAIDTFKDLLSDQDFTDVTLACEDNKQVKAHKAILSSSSNFFKRILKNNPHQHTLIYLKGITWSNLQAIIQFIYLGQTEVDRESFETSMNDAKELEVKGLGDIHETKLLSNIATDVEPDKIILDSSYFEDTILPDVFPTVQVTVEDDSYQQTSALAIKKDKDQKYPCNQCSYKADTVSHLRGHQENLHKSKSV